MKTLRDVEDALEAAKGREVMAKLSAPVDPHEHDLPIRHHVTGKIVAYVPEALADGLLPVAHNGLVVGYYRDFNTFTASPAVFYDGTARALVETALGSRWMCCFLEDGTPDGGLRIA